MSQATTDDGQRQRSGNRHGYGGRHSDPKRRFATELLSL
ncbi:hypothetical protein A2U01_0072533, partial [Trifolium medium]|nr:hypothetical protein [Trifolium medium]